MHTSELLSSECVKEKRKYHRPRFFDGSSGVPGDLTTALSIEPLAAGMTAQGSGDAGCGRRCQRRSRLRHRWRRPSAPARSGRRRPSRSVAAPVTAIPQRGSRRCTARLPRPPARGCGGNSRRRLARGARVLDVPVAALATMACILAMRRRSDPQRLAHDSAPQRLAHLSDAKATHVRRQSRPSPPGAGASYRTTAATLAVSTGANSPIGNL